jgi:type IV secretory pathway TraG/TraD family ATPase VirD4
MRHKPRRKRGSAKEPGAAFTSVASSTKKRQAARQDRVRGRAPRDFFRAERLRKGVRFLMPNLLGDYLKGRSVVVIDPKGELAAVCAGRRRWMERKRPGSVKILDPFGKLRQCQRAQPSSLRCRSWR